MAKREFQMPSVLQHGGPRPYWYIRYRQKVLVGKDQIERKERWHTLGYCDEVTKREAIITQLVNKSAQADLRATTILLGLMQDIERRAGAITEPTSLSEADRQVLEFIRNRRLAVKEGESDV